MAVASFDVKRDANCTPSSKPSDKRAMVNWLSSGDPDERSTTILSVRSTPNLMNGSLASRLCDELLYA